MSRERERILENYIGKAWETMKIYEKLEENRKEFSTLELSKVVIVIDCSILTGMPLCMHGLPACLFVVFLLFHHQSRLCL